MLKEQLGRQVWHRTELGMSEELIVSSLGWSRKQGGMWRCAQV